ncbi:tape measure protein [Oscillibacter ruminantium]|uniref:tape measure protein n=1 Tax=Oscillibacter ruminantium TaxID=1263547 RepID=UPI0002FFA6CF|nr:tape measure protein [Oscillibacter ruminantium]
MADSISIVMKMNEDITGKMKSIASMSQGCSKEMEELGRRTTQLGERYNQLNKHAAEVSAKAATVKIDLDAAKKLMKETGCTADAVDFKNLQEQYNALSASASSYQKMAKSALKETTDSYEQFRKMDLGLGSSPTRKAADKIEASLGDKLAQSGLFKMFGDSLASAAGIGLESALGQPMATFGSSLASGAATGASAGALFGNPLLGAGIGAVAGGINGATQIYQQEDDAFKSYYAGLYGTVKAGTADSLTTGGALAASRETTKLSFSTLLGGDTQADAFLKDVLNTANTTPFLYDDLTGISKTLLSFGYAVEDIIPTLTKVGDAGAAMGLGTADINTVASYIGRMRSSDKASLEYLNPLNERGLSVFEWLSDDLGISQKAVYDKISKGDLSGTYVSDLILGQFEKLYGGMMEIQSHSTEGLDSTLQGLMENINAAGGEGYNSIRNRGTQNEIDAYGGALGDALKDLNGIIGENQAYMENLQDQYTREALSAVLLGEQSSLFKGSAAERLSEMRGEFLNAQETDRQEGGNQEAKLSMESLKEQAEALATAAYESSDQYQKMHDAELDQIDAIRENTAGLEAATNALKTSNAFSKGGASSIFDLTYDKSSANLSFNSGISKHEVWKHGVKSSNAFGLRRVPETGLYLLHQDETVKTAAETREAGGFGGVNVNMTGPVTIRQESDIARLGAEFRRELELARMRSS